MICGRMRRYRWNEIACGRMRWDKVWCDLGEADQNASGSAALHVKDVPWASAAGGDAVGFHNMPWNAVVCGGMR